jgi:hypothetical protein
MLAKDRRGMEVAETAVRAPRISPGAGREVVAYGG